METLHGGSDGRLFKRERHTENSHHLGLAITISCPLHLVYQGRFVERGYLPVQPGALICWPPEGSLTWRRGDLSNRPALNVPDPAESHPLFAKVNVVDAGPASYHTQVRPFLGLLVQGISPITGRMRCR